MAKKNQGFSLLQLSIIVAALGLIAAATLPSRDDDNTNAKYLITLKRMKKIENASEKMMATWGRRPCPASGTYKPGDANFGTEDGADQGDCVTSRGTSNAVIQSGNIVAGTVPVKKLHLPDEYAYDGWGRPFTYIVDKRATSKASCVDTTFTSGDVTVSNNGTTENTMMTLVSHGPDGYGAFLPQGSTVANRFNSGATDADQYKNVAGSNFASPSYASALVRKEKTSTFDDFVWYSDPYKNTCCLGAVCKEASGGGGGGDNILIEGGADNQGFGTILASGDINSDGKQDIVIGNALTVPAKAIQAYAVFGAALPLPNPYSPSFDGSDGFIINTDFNIRHMKMGDFDGDGKKDLILTGDGKIAVLYGQASAFSWPASVTISQATGVMGNMTGTYGMYIYTDTTRGELGQTLDVGTFSGAKEDILVSQFDAGSVDPVKAAGHIIVLAGRARTGTTVYDLSTLLNGTTGWRFAGDTSTTNYTIGYNLLFADINGNGMNDIMMVRYNNTNGGATSDIYSIFGENISDWTTGDILLSDIYSDTDKYLVISNANGTMGGVVMVNSYYGASSHTVMMNTGYASADAFEIQGYMNAHVTGDDYTLVGAQGNDSWGESNMGMNGEVWSADIQDLKAAIYPDPDNDFLPDNMMTFGNTLNGGNIIYECLSGSTCQGGGYSTPISGRYDASFYAHDSSTFGNQIAYLTNFTGSGDAFAIADTNYSGTYSNAGRVYIMFNWNTSNDFTGGNLPGAAGGGGSAIEPY